MSLYLIALDFSNNNTHKNSLIFLCQNQLLNVYLGIYAQFMLMPFLFSRIEWANMDLKNSEEIFYLIFFFRQFLQQQWCCHFSNFLVVLNFSFVLFKLTKRLFRMIYSILWADEHHYIIPSIMNFSFHISHVKEEGKNTTKQSHEKLHTI